MKKTIERSFDDCDVHVSEDRQTVTITIVDTMSFPFHLTRTLSGLLSEVALVVEVEKEAEADPLLGKALRIELQEDISVKTLHEWVKNIRATPFSLGFTLLNALTQGSSFVTYPHSIRRLLEWSYSNPNNPFVMSIENAPL